MCLLKATAVVEKKEGGGEITACAISQSQIHYGLGLRWAALDWVPALSVSKLCLTNQAAHFSIQ